MKRWTIAVAAVGLLLTGACSKGGTETPTTTAPPPAEGSPTDEPAERESLTAAECEAKGGSVVGDIGDGAIHRPEYRCENGEPPLGSIKAEGDGPIATEGAVCCGS